MRFDASGVDPQMIDLINQNISRIEDWIMTSSQAASRSNSATMFNEDDPVVDLSVKKGTRTVVDQPHSRRHDLELENLLGHAKSIVPYPPFLLP